MLTLKEAEKLLIKNGQEHVLNGFSALSEDEKKELLSDVSKLDFVRLTDALSKEPLSHGTITPLSALTAGEIEKNKDEYEKKGRELLLEGRCAALILAGGMGTRLGSEKPKGELNVGETKDLFLFECLINNLKKAVERISKKPPLLIMTSERNDEETRRFLKEHGFFGYPEEKVHFFVQDTAPAVDFNGKLLLEAPGRLATSPNGNGGWFRSLKNAGLISVLKNEGVEWINIFSVDNPLQKICDPVFLGATVMSQKPCGGKVIRKNTPDEKLGVICLDDGHPSIVEYYEMTDAMHDERDDKGELLYAYGVILNYLFRIDLLENIVDRALPVHIVEKKIPYVDENKKLINPDKPNGYKFELLILDMIGLMDDILCFEVIREREFAPIKNLHGIDSLDSARDLMKKNGIEL